MQGKYVYRDTLVSIFSLLLHCHICMHTLVSVFTLAISHDRQQGVYALQTPYTPSCTIHTIHTRMCILSASSCVRMEGWISYIEWEKMPACGAHALHRGGYFLCPWGNPRKMQSKKHETLETWIPGNMLACCVLAIVGFVIPKSVSMRLALSPYNADLGGVAKWVIMKW